MKTRQIVTGTLLSGIASFSTTDIAGNTVRALTGNAVELIQGFRYLEAP